MYEYLRKHAATELGLPENATWEQIDQARVNRDDLRKSYAAKLGLSENANYDKIKTLSP